MKDFIFYLTLKLVRIPISQWHEKSRIYEQNFYYNNVQCFLSFIWRDRDKFENTRNPCGRKLYVG